MKLLRAFLADKSGATAIEYGLIAGLMCIALIAGFGAFTNNLTAMFNLLANKVSVNLP
jgi:pilus assembly protein Flp/PilA